MLGPVAIIGIIIFLGFWAARGAKLIKFPMVVGYVIAGLILGDSVARILGDQIRPGLEVITMIALSLIGFGIGTQFEMKVLRKLGKSVILIALMEAMGAFVLVLAGSWIVTGNLGIALIFAALATATAPAATSEVLREYKAKGKLTSTLYAVVGFDDAISLIIFSLILPISINIICKDSASAFCLRKAINPFITIGGSLLLGSFGGFLMVIIHKIIKAKEDILIMSIGVILTFAGLADHLNFSLILTSMTMGIFAVNFSRIKTGSIMNAIKGFAPPIYVIFFVTAGAELDVRLLPTISILGVVYILTRALGKYFGSFLGATVTKSGSKIRKYLGFGLLDQAGVAIGLAVAISNKLGAMGGEKAKMGTQIVNIVTAAVFVSMILAPILIKYAIFKSGEAQNKT